MADYKELLRKAIKALPESNGAARRGVYEKARAALVGQLRAIAPPLPAKDITQHRLHLEDCIRAVEQETSEAIISLKRQDESLPARGKPEAPKAAEIGPISRDGLVQEYLDRHKDSDYGFQAEFEMLPDRFPDRTTEDCDKQTNRPRNRYPDIKCYDQTRVKLNELEDKESSDYINANFVAGYTERKRWICAQGPLEHTVADFWRMIYEQVQE